MLHTLCFAVLFSFPPPCSQQSRVQSGIASFYANKFEGKKTANGEIFSNSSFTAAHKTLSFHTLVRVTNPENGQSVIVRINDRGPHVKGRIIDLSTAAARKIGLNLQGMTPVEVEAVYNTPLTPELDSIFRSHLYSDCLGNLDSLNGFTVSVFRSENLQHVLYLANDLQDLTEKEKVIIQKERELFYIFITGLPNLTACEALIHQLRQNGFFKAAVYKPAR